MTRGFQWDLARQVERLDWLLQQLPRYADWGYDELYLHLEDAVEYPSLPGVARPGAYSYRQLERLVAATGRAGLKVVPIVNLLGHTQYLLNVPSLRDLNECRGPDGSPLAHGQICPVHPRTPEIVDRLLRDIAPLCTAGKVHVGLDESYHLGRHPLSRAEIASIGLAGHFAGYVQRLHTAAGGHGLRLGLWADMLALLPEAIPLLPPGIIAYDWYYYPFHRLPRIELRNFAEYDLAGPLRAQGVEYWGCPMSGAFRHEPLPIVEDRLGNIVSWWRRCRQTKAAGLLVTSWEPQRLAAEVPAAIDAAAAGLWLDGEEDIGRLLAGGCRRMFGSRGARTAGALRAADRHPFSGYGRWQANDRWDTLLAPEPLAPWRAEAQACQKLAAKRGLPPAVSTSLRFRAYLAERDLFVRAAGQAVWQVRAALADGQRSRALRLIEAQESAAAEFAKHLVQGRIAAQAMWRRTRAARVQGPNETVIEADTARLRGWQAWLKQCRRRPSRAASSSPVAGAWQFTFIAHNFAPAAQKVVVQRRESSGTWKDLHGCFLIEFQARAAKPRAALSQIFSAPIIWEGSPAKLPQLRIAIRGFGQVGIDRIHLTDGVQHFLPAKKKAFILGRKASSRGYPDFDWQKNRGTWTPILEYKPSAVS